MSEKPTVDIQGGFQLGDWRVEPRLGELRSLSTGRVVSLRPKSMQVLLELVAAGGDVVDRETLRNDVWPETLASDESLSRCIADVRRVLASQGDDNTYIETLPKRGYRLAVNVESAAPEMARGRAGGKVSRRTLAWVIAVVLVGILIIAGFTGVRFPGASPASETVIVAVHVVEDPGASHGDRLLLLAVSDLLYQRLSETPGLVVRAPRVPRAEADPASLAGGASLSLSLAPTSGAEKRQLLVELHASGQSASAPVALGRFEVPKLESEAGIGAFVNVREDIVARVGERLFPALAISEAERAIQPKNAEAFHWYLEARDLMSQPGCDGTAPNVLLERSLALDPEFVPARVALGWANYGLAATCGLGAEYYEEALAQANEALRLADTWVPATALMATVMVETGKARRAVATLEGALEQHPDSPYLHFAMSYALVYTGKLEEAEARLERTLALDPLFLVAEGWTPNALLYQGENERFLAMLPATESTLFDFYRGFVLHRLGRTEQARDNLAAAFRRHPGDVFGMLSGALLAVLDNDVERASQQLQALDYRRKETENRDGEVTFRTAQIAALMGDDTLARRLVEEGWDQGFTCRQCIEADPVLGELLGNQAIPNR